MRERIIEEIRNIEQEYEVRVCFAVESGSRALGFPSKESDYDVRFIYVHKKEWYLSIDEKRDVIELPINDTLDMSGWELRKTLRLFQKSNPPLMEWLNSEIVYYQAFSLVDKMKAIQDQVFLPQATVYHYLNMAKKNYKDYIQREEVKVKKFFYVLRPILACSWIERYSTVPPADLQVLLACILPNGLLKQEIESLIKRKMSGDKSKIDPNISIINQYVEQEIGRIQDYLKNLQVKKKEGIITDLNTLFRHVLGEVWS